MNQDILLANGWIAIDGAEHAVQDYSVTATLLAKLAYFGYTLDHDAFTALARVEDIGAWWDNVQNHLGALTGDNRKMAEHMVYKNFPKEVMDMNRATQLVHQALIYWGVPLENLVQQKKPRDILEDMASLRVLKLADDSTEKSILDSLIRMPTCWNNNQEDWAKKLFKNRNAVIASDFGFKVNAITIACENFEIMEFDASSATDIMRLAAALSGGDKTLRERVAFKHFSRPHRRRILAQLDQQKHLAQDMAERPELWKRLIERLHPGEYNFENVKKAQNSLYNRQTKSIQAQLDPLVASTEVLDIASTRPGEFYRRFHHYYSLFDELAVEKFLPVIEHLSNGQLASLRSYLRTINERKSMIYAPRSNWARAQVVPNNKKKISSEHLAALDSKIARVLEARFGKRFENGLWVDPALQNVRLPTNDQKLAEYGRGTEFDISNAVTFIRSASYWENNPDMGITWYDNGWNFFNSEWKSLGACGWNEQHFRGKAAIFSGDPVNLHNKEGRACQMADLYLDKLQEQGVRYAVWSVLCFSRKRFSEATGEVLATLQMGENALKGKVYEPSRAQMTFVLKSEQYTSYVAYIDLLTRKLVYMDAALPSDTSSVAHNGEKLSKYMPAYLEYLAAQPSIVDLVATSGGEGTPILYSDKASILNQGQETFVFKPENQESSWQKLTLTDLLSTN